MTRLPNPYYVDRALERMKEEHPEFTWKPEDVTGLAIALEDYAAACAHHEALKARLSYEFGTEPNG
jgi:hypothetical protein